MLTTKSLKGNAFFLQAEAERRKRAQILESEGDRQSKINVAEGDKAQVILSSEAAKQDAVNRATGTPCFKLTNCCTGELIGFSSFWAFESAALHLHQSNS